MIRFFVDFDGTVATEDVVDRALERFADKSWKAAEKDWVEGRIGSRECLTRQIALVKASKAEMDALLDEVTIDPGFGRFLVLAAERSIPVAIVSDGFDYFIRGILDRTLKSGWERTLPVYSNRLLEEGGRWSAKFAEPCEHGCANCKQRLLKRLSRIGEGAVFVGDGLSDRYAASAADLTFAKSRLLTHCRENAVSHKPYLTFGEIGDWILEGRWDLKKTTLQRS